MEHNQNNSTKIVLADITKSEFCVYVYIFGTKSGLWASQLQCNKKKTQTLDAEHLGKLTTFNIRDNCTVLTDNYQLLVVAG